MSKSYFISKILILTTLQDAKCLCICSSVYNPTKISTNVTISTSTFSSSDVKQFQVFYVPAGDKQRDAMLH